MEEGHCDDGRGGGIGGSVSQCPSLSKWKKYSVSSPGISLLDISRDTRRDCVTTACRVWFPACPGAVSTAGWTRSFGVDRDERARGEFGARATRGVNPRASSRGNPARECRRKDRACRDRCSRGNENTDTGKRVCSVARNARLRRVFVRNRTIALLHDRYETCKDPKRVASATRHAVTRRVGV